MMIDIHTHILFSVDDGSKDLAMSLDMINLELENKVSSIILTPHFSYEGTFEKREKLIKDHFLILKNKIEELNIPISLALGAEIMYTDSLYQRMKEGKEIISLPNSHLLVEFPLFHYHQRVIDKIYPLTLFNYKIILAHPERYEYLTIEDLKEIKSFGVKFQINSTSLNKAFSKSIYHRAKTLLKEGLVDFIASDCHENKIRKPNLLEVTKYLKKYKITNNLSDE